MKKNKFFPLILLLGFLPIFGGCREECVIHCTTNTQYVSGTSTHTYSRPLSKDQCEEFEEQYEEEPGTICNADWGD